MSLGNQIAWDDTVLPFQLDRANVRGRVARLDGVLNTVLAQHNYPPQIEALVAEAVLLTALIGASIKLRWKLSLQIRGSGAARIIATDYFAPKAAGEPAQIRAYASFDEARLTDGASDFEQIGEGFFAILMDQGEGTEPYQGITPLVGGSLAACAQTYFDQSEQIPTRFSLSFGQSQLPGKSAQWRGGGVMLQHLPAASPQEEQGDDWNRANILLDSVEDLELIGPTVSPAKLLTRLFHEEEPRVYDAQPVTFGCTCSPDKVRQSMSIYSAKDIAHMTTDDGKLTADCQFCGAHYEFAPDTLGFEAKGDAADDA